MKRFFDAIGEFAVITGFSLLVLALFWWAIAVNVFLWKNPTANKMVLIREFPAVVTFQKLEAYQPKGR